MFSLFFRISTSTVFFAGSCMFRIKWVSPPASARDWERHYEKEKNKERTKGLLHKHLGRQVRAADTNACRRRSLGYYRKSQCELYNSFFTVWRSHLFYFISFWSIFLLPCMNGVKAGPVEDEGGKEVEKEKEEYILFLFIFFCLYCVL